MTRFLLFGVAGWALENATSSTPRYSQRLEQLGLHLPFLPVYGVGGVVLGALAPAVRPLPLPLRFGSYSAALTLVEYLAGKLDRAVNARPSWDYEGEARGVSVEGLIDWKHAAGWGAAGVLLEQTLT